jgi:predicted amidohydrolase
LICYDLRFPVWSRNLNDYDLLLYVANWPERRNYAWKQLLVARAIENQCYVAGVNRIGADGNEVIHSGDSVVLNYKGEALSKIPSHEENVTTISISYDELATFRQQFPVMMDADDFEFKNLSSIL